MGVGLAAAYTMRKEVYYCPDCRGRLEYIEKYDGWYCRNCEEYKY